MGERDPGGKQGRGGGGGGGRATSDPTGADTPGTADPALTLARTTTLDDPLTTSLLAEVARRSQTIEVSPDQIKEAIDEAADAASTTTATPAPVDDPRRRTQR